MRTVLHAGGESLTLHAVLVDPPRPGVVLDILAAEAPVTEAEAAKLYAAMAKDTLRAVEGSGGELLVNYRPDDLLPGESGDAEAEVRALAEEALDEPEAARFEVQVGSTFAARTGNTATHLLREESVSSVAILEPTAPTVTRVALDGAAMKLRRHGAVIGPAPGGRVYYLGLTGAIDFEGAYDSPAQVTLADRAVNADHDVEFLGMHPVVETAADLASVVATVEARRIAGVIVPRFTAAAIDELGLTADGQRVARTGRA